MISRFKGLMQISQDFGMFFGLASLLFASIFDQNGLRPYYLIFSPSAFNVSIDKRAKKLYNSVVKFYHIRRTSDMSERRLFQVNGNLVYAINDFVKNNTFIGQEVQTDELPLYENEKHRLPRPVWDGHEDAIKCYNKTWEIAFRNLRKANPDAGFVSNFIDTAFNGFLFMWDSSFILMFGKYGDRIFKFQHTLDNMYSHQQQSKYFVSARKASSVSKSLLFLYKYIQYRIDEFFRRNTLLLVKDY